MAREIATYCDNHPGQDVPGTTRRLDLGEGPRETELCDPCWDTLTLAETRKVLDAHGRDISDNPTRTKLRCPFCTHPGLATARNLRDHVDTKHPDQAEAFLAAIANPRRGRRPTPLTPRPTDEPPPPPPPPPNPDGTYTCPDTGCNKNYDTAKGLGSHRRHAHGVEGVRRNPEHVRPPA